MFAGIVNDNTYTWTPNATRTDENGNTFIKVGLCIATCSAGVTKVISPKSVAGVPYWAANALASNGLASSGSAYLSSLTSGVAGFVGIAKETINASNSGWFQIGGYCATWYNAAASVSVSNGLRLISNLAIPSVGTNFCWMLNEFGWATEAATNSYSAIYMVPKLTFQMEY